MEAKRRKAGLLHGVPAIADNVDMTEPRCRNRIAVKMIPAFKLGGPICRTATINRWTDDAMEASNGKRS